MILYDIGVEAYQNRPNATGLAGVRDESLFPPPRVGQGLSGPKRLMVLAIGYPGGGTAICKSGGGVPRTPGTA